MSDDMNTRLTTPTKDMQIIRDLAKTVAEIASNPIQAEKRDM